MKFASAFKKLATKEAEAVHRRSEPYKKYIAWDAMAGLKETPIWTVTGYGGEFEQVKWARITTRDILADDWEVTTL